MIAALESGSGKTSITCALLNIFAEMGLCPMSFKCGPDYIDPIFHRSVLGIESENIDLYMSDEETVKFLISKKQKNHKILVLEGVMGYYDGLAGKTDIASSYDISKRTNTPVVLVVNCKGASLTYAAIIKGAVEFRKDSSIKGIILNKTIKSMYIMLKEVIERETGIAVLGYVPLIDEAAFESRYLGLSFKDGNESIIKKIDVLSCAVKESVDIDALIKIAFDAPKVISGDDFYGLVNKNINGNGVRIACAFDDAFNFYYGENLELIKKTGAQIVYFSPLKNQPVPENCNGLLLGGGYPELFAKELSKNKISVNSVKKAVKCGMPTIAECGGFMYLCRSVENDEGVFEMCGIIETDVKKGQKLGNFGYVSLKSKEESVFGDSGTELRGHEFHYYKAEDEGNGFIAQKPMSNKKWCCVHCSKSLYAGFPHIYFHSNLSALKTFIEKCADFEKREI